MRALVFDQTGPPAQVLRLADLPDPGAPGPGQVRLRVEARPVNPSDAMFIQGMYGIQPVLPQVAGFEAAGTIEALGEGVAEAAGLAVGQRVAFTHTGTWAEALVLPARGLIVVPEAMAPETAAQLYVNPFTALALLHDLALAPGDWLLQTAGASAFGKLIIQLARQLGLRTISTVRRPEAVAPLLALGADAVVDLSQERLPRRVRELTGGAPLRAALDAVGGATGAEALKCLDFGGTLIVYGLLSLEPLPLNSGLLIFKNITVKGFWLSEWLQRAPKEARQAVAQQVTDQLASGALEAPVEAIYDLADFAQALAHHEAPGRMGKIILRG